MAVILRCPVCRGKFKYDVSNGWPDFCQIKECGADINNRRDDDDVVCPNILSFKTKNADAIARSVMDGGDKRMEMAAAHAGVSPEEMASLKITDLTDNPKDIWPTRDVVNPVSQQMDMINARGGKVGFGSSQGSEYAAQAHAPLPGIGKVFAPNAGIKTMHQMQKALPTIGQAPLPLEISNNPGYRSRV